MMFAQATETKVGDLYARLAGMRSGLGILIAAHTRELPGEYEWNLPSYYAVRQREGLREYSPRFTHSLICGPFSGYSDRVPISDRP